MLINSQSCDQNFFTMNAVDTQREERKGIHDVTSYSHAPADKANQPLPFRSLEQEMTNHGPRAKSHCHPFYVNKVFWNIAMPLSLLTVFMLQ